MGQTQKEIAGQASLASLAESALEHPKKVKKIISLKLAETFGLPTEAGDLWMYQLAVKDGDCHRAFAVRPRSNGQVDIFLIKTIPAMGTTFYYATAEGKLLRSTHAVGDTTVIPNDKAQKGYEAELYFWRTWMQLQKLPEASK